MAVLSDSYHHLPSESHTATVHGAPRSAKEGRNAIQVYGDCVDECHHSIYTASWCSPSLFDSVLSVVLDDLRRNVFPQFVRSPLYRVYVACIASLGSVDCSGGAISPSCFASLRVLGRGAFGFVNAVIKRDSGHIYAMKCISKRRVMATDSVDTIMSERNFLSEMSSQFVTGLKYATQDEHTLYLIIDLMVGGDLKFHLNKEGRFSVERSRFYAAEVLLGLEHIHSKGLLFRYVVILGSFSLSPSLYVWV